MAATKERNKSEPLCRHIFTHGPHSNVYRAHFDPKESAIFLISYKIDFAKKKET